MRYYPFLLSIFWKSCFDHIYLFPFDFYLQLVIVGLMYLCKIPILAQASSTALRSIISGIYLKSRGMLKVTSMVNEYIYL